MLPLAYANEGEVWPMRTEVRANRPVDEDHVTLRQCCWPLIEGDLGPLGGDGEGDANRLRSRSDHGPAITTTIGASIGPSLVSTPTTRPPAVRRPVTMTPSRRMAPCCCARCMKAVVVARGSAYPLSGS